MEGPTEQNFEVRGLYYLNLKHEISCSEIEGQVLDNTEGRILRPIH
jgi:hypothetical protein